MRKTVALAAIGCFLTLSPVGSAARAQNLYAWARQVKPFVGVSKVGLYIDAPVARHVAPGQYRLHVAARSDMAFHLVGPGIDRQTMFTSAYGAPIYATWRVQLKRGRYTYAAEGVYAKQLRAAGLRIRGSFSVP